MFDRKSLTEKERKLLQSLLVLGGSTRQRLQRQTHYSAPTVYRVIDDLVHRGIVRISGTEEDPGKGRPTERVVLREDACYLFSVHITRGAYYTAMVDLGGTLHEYREHLFEGVTSPQAVVEQAYADFSSAAQKLEVQKQDVPAVALAVVGPIDYEHGRMKGPTYFLGGEWADVPIVEMLEKRFSMHVEYDCNASACLMGHYIPRYYDTYANMAYITLGTGIGSGLVLEHKLHLRHHVILDGLAHMRVELNGRRCPTCGAYGCVEAYASKNAIVQECARALRLGRKSGMRDKLDTLCFEDVCAALDAGDPLAEAVAEEAASVFAVCLMNYLRIVDLEAVILGGSLIEQLPGWFDKIQTLANEQSGLRIRLIRGDKETENTLRGIAVQYLLGVLLK